MQDGLAARVRSYLAAAAQAPYALGEDMATKLQVGAVWRAWGWARTPLVNLGLVLLQPTTRTAWVQAEKALILYVGTAHAPTSYT